MDIYTTWQDTIKTAFLNVWGVVKLSVPTLIAALIVFIVGWIVASFLGKIVTKILAGLKIDSALRGTEVEKVINRAGFNLNVAYFFGAIVEWFVIIVAFVATFNVLHLSDVNTFLLSVLSYIPSVIVAVAILLVAAVAGETLQKVVRGSVHATGVGSASLLGSITKWSIWIFGLLSALYQLQIAPDFLNTLFMGIVVALALAFGLSFGLGGQQAAAEYIAKIRSEISGK